MQSVRDIRRGRQAGLIAGLWPLALILLLAAGARFHHLEDRTVWTDEGWTAWATLDRSADSILTVLRDDRHPPLFFLALGGWEDLAGESRLALRFLSALGGIVTAAVVYRIGADWFGHAAGAYAALLYAALDIAIYYDQEIRHYGWLTLALSLMTLFFLRYVRHPRARWLVGYAVSTALMLTTNYFGLPVLAWQAVLALVIWRGSSPAAPWRDKLRLIGAWAAAALLCVPVMTRLFSEHLHKLLFAASSQGIPFSLEPGWDSFWTICDYLFGHQPAMLLSLYLLGAGAILVGFAWRSTEWLARASIVAAGGGMFLALYAASLHTPTLTPRTLVFVTPMLMLVCGYALSRLPQPAGITGAAVLVVTLLVYGEPVQPHLNYTAAAQAVAAGYAPGDLIVLETGWDDNAFWYELQRALPDADPAITRTLPWVEQGEPASNRPVVPQIEDSLRSARRVWVVQWLQAASVIPYLDEGADGFQRVREQTTLIGEAYAATYPNDPLIRAVLFERPDLAREPVVFGAEQGADQFALRDVVLPAWVQAGAVLPVDLWWSAPGLSAQDYSAGVYLLAAGEDRVVAQHDGALGGLATSQWAGDPPVVDARLLALPDDLPPGEYRVAVGVYWFGDGVPLAVEGQPGAAFALVGTVRVE